MNIEEMNLQEIETRKAELNAEIDTAEGDALVAIEAEIDALNERQDLLEKKAEARKAVEEGAGVITKEFEEERKTMFGVETIEYRDAWTKRLINRDMSEEERAALATASYVIPTMTVNAVWDRLIKPAELLGKVDVSQFPSYVRFPKVATVGAATAQAVGAVFSESSDAFGYVDLIPNEYVKLLTVGADIDHMAIPAVHDWIVKNLTDSIRYAINKDIVVGSGSNALNGLATAIAANTGNLPDTITKASILKVMGSLDAQYQNGAIWIMTPTMFYENILTLTQFNDYVVNDGFQYKLFGHDVVLMSECLISSNETIFYGDPAAYKLNIFKALEVKPFETATTTNIQFRGATMADGDLLDTRAFVRFGQT